MSDQPAQLMFEIACVDEVIQIRQRLAAQHEAAQRERQGSPVPAF